MRLLARIPVDTEVGNGNFNVFIVRKDRLFAISDKFHYKPNGVGSAQLILKYKNNNFTVLDCCISKAGNKSKIGLSDALIDYIKNTLIIDDVKNKYTEISAKNNVSIVRSLNKCTYSVYAAPQQGFGTVRDQVITWKSCREEFAKDFHKSTLSIFFCTSPFSDKKKDFIGARLRTRRVARFIRRIEDILKLKKYSVCLENSSYNVMEIEVPDFWSANDLNRSLYTILPRAGLLYDFQKDNYLEALKGYSYSANTMHAVLRFLDGCTKYVGAHKTGWQNTFYGLDKKSVDKVLVKP